MAYSNRPSGSGMQVDIPIQRRENAQRPVPAQCGGVSDGAHKEFSSALSHHNRNEPLLSEQALRQFKCSNDISDHFFTSSQNIEDWIEQTNRTNEHIQQYLYSHRHDKKYRQSNSAKLPGYSSDARLQTGKNRSRDIPIERQLGRLALGNRMEHQGASDRPESASRNQPSTSKTGLSRYAESRNQNKRHQDAMRLGEFHHPSHHHHENNVNN